MPLKKISRIAILSALAIVLRIAFAGLPNIQPITAIFLVCAVFYGLWESVLIMSVTMLVTSFLLGFGPWVLGQIISFASILFLWKFICYPLTKSLPLGRIKEMILQAVLAGLMSILYGIIVDAYSALLFAAPLFAYILAGMTFNLMHAVSTMLFYPLIVSIFRRFVFNEKTM
ncbi:ECF transporter S component [Streptococcus caviae]|uniref:ECF transporter S component n=1 Tax=Streptococcus sp. 'caviae' TaxID=1915004 RepID=UPI00094BA2B5|nr:ECF transporter S component [Streptococcus sp. 'caviae']OLN83641.1 ECF transporter S component [Streptococcus sp. 'caviae']